MNRLFVAVCLWALSLTISIATNQTKEILNRAPVAVKTSQGILVSWRYLSTDGNATFSVYRNGTQIATNISTKTNYLDKQGEAGDTYKVVSSNGGEATATAWNSMYTTLEIKRPSALKNYNASGTGRYRPDDMSVADLDGDGDYELVLKWMPDNGKDNAQKGYTSPCIFSAYEMDGTPIWSKNINLGYSIRTGNHYTPFLVYDMDGDGKAELICKTGSDSRDGKGNLVTAKGDSKIQAIGEKTNLAFNSNGHIIKGEELLTVFNGATGEAMNTIWYSPSRDGSNFPTASTDNSGFFGDSNRNRGERYNACVAYLDGLDQLPTAIMERGYYASCFLWAVDWDGTQLKTRWLHKGTGKNAWSTLSATGTKLYDQTTDPVYYQNNSGKGLASSYGQGVHGISVGDVNNDGKDEIVIGSATIGPDGKLMCATGFGHGDAIHLADLVPSRPGLEVMMPHEESNSFGAYGYDVHDAATGEVLVHETGTADNGRGIAGNFIPANANSVCWSSAFKMAKDCGTGTQISAKYGDTNFRIYWTGDPYDQTFDGRYSTSNGGCSPRITCMNRTGSSNYGFQTFYNANAAMNPATCNTTKATPCLQADILGDWREEIIMYANESDWSNPYCYLMIYSTPEPTNYKVPCLMEDHVYRMGIVWQNSSYNQPPHLGYNLANYLNVNGSAYTMQTTSHAPAVIKADDSALTETLTAPADDKGEVSGTCYSAGANGELTASVSNTLIKMRTGNNNNTITFTVNSGYVITGIKVYGYSNNTSTTADRSITLTDITVDGTTPVLKSAVVFPGGTAGQDAVTAEAKDFTATRNIVLSFDNSKITSKEVDANGKNTQIYASVTFTYAKAATGIDAVNASAKVPVIKTIRNGRILIIRNGKEYNIAGQKTN